MVFRKNKSLNEDFLAADEILFDAAQTARLESVVTPLQKPLRRPGLIMIAAVVLGMLALGLARVAQLAIFDGPDYALEADQSHYTIKWSPAGRGRIVDRQGQDLVVNTASSSLVVLPYALPKQESDLIELISTLARAANLDPGQLGTVIKALDRRETLAAVIKDELGLQETLYLGELLKYNPAFSVETRGRRHYLLSPAAATVLGYTGRVNPADLKLQTSRPYLGFDYVGRAGLEAAYEEVLRGAHGGVKYLVNARGERLNEVAQYEAQPGATLTLAIDSGLQQVVYEALNKALGAAQSPGAAAVVLNPRNGEILALVSLPTYDNNLFSAPLGDDDFKKLFESPGKPLFNRAMTGVYPPGSTIKPVVGMGALAEQVVAPDYSLFVTGSIVVTSQVNPQIQYVFRDWRAHGWVDYERALAVSSNVYFYTLAGGYGDVAGLGIDRLAQYMRLFGLGEKLGIDLPGEHPGVVPDPAWKEAVHGEPWYIGDTYHQAIGQGDLRVTPLQVAAYTGAVATAGQLYEPHLVTKIGDQTVAPKIIRQLDLPESAFRSTRQGLRRAVTEGSARLLNTLSVAVAGKTGTAEPGGGLKPHAWFTGFAPYENPSLVITVLIEHGGEGSAVSVPVAAEVFRWAAQNDLF